jgi:branched-chain amino acid transport system ATP-binding protein
MPSYRVARAGMVRTFQLTKALSKMKVIDNMRLGAGNQKGERLVNAMFPFTWRSQEASITTRADQILARFNLDAKREDFAGSLSGGQRKLLEMARALMSDPTMLMLDEPMAGVNPALTQALLDHVISLREDGMTILFVEHDMDAVRHIADWVIVMAQGRIIAEGPPDSVMNNDAVVNAYLGGHHDQALTASGVSFTDEVTP